MSQLPLFPSVPYPDLYSFSVACSLSYLDLVDVHRAVTSPSDLSDAELSRVSDYLRAMSPDHRVALMGFMGDGLGTFQRNALRANFRLVYRFSQVK